MGAVYTVEFDLRFNETGREKFSDRLREYLKNLDSTGKAVVNIPERDTLEENMSALLRGMEINKNTLFRFTGHADFTASYGWETVMTDTFLFAMSACEEGTEIYIYPDSDYDKLEIVNGKPEWTH